MHFRVEKSLTQHDVAGIFMRFQFIPIIVWQIKIKFDQMNQSNEFFRPKFLSWFKRICELGSDEPIFQMSQAHEDVNE